MASERVKVCSWALLGTIARIRRNVKIRISMKLGTPGALILLGMGLLLSTFE